MPNSQKEQTFINRKSILILATAGILGGFFGAILFQSPEPETIVKESPIITITNQDQQKIFKTVDEFLKTLEIPPLQYTVTSLEDKDSVAVIVRLTAFWPSIELDSADEREEEIYLEKSGSDWEIREDLSLN